MPKLLYIKNRHSIAGNQKFVFENTIEKPGQQAAGAAQKASVGFAEQHEKKNNTDLNVKAPFSPDPDKVFDILGAAAHEKNPTLSAESIKQNFIDTLEHGKTIDEAWAYLASKDCQTARIINGYLKFFAGPPGSNEISLAEFFKPFNQEIGGPGSMTETYLEIKQQILAQNSEKLKNFQIQNNLPERPSQQAT